MTRVGSSGRSEAGAESVSSDSSRSIVAISVAISLAAAKRSSRFFASIRRSSVSSRAGTERSSEIGGGSMCRIW